MVVGGHRGHKVRKNSTREIESTSLTTLSQSWDRLVIVSDFHFEIKGTREEEVSQIVDTPVFIFAELIESLWCTVQ